MEIVRPIERYPWAAIGSWFCVLLPLASAVYFFPAFHGGWYAFSVDLWVRATLYMAAQCLPLYRWLALKDAVSSERTLQLTLAIAFPQIASFAGRDNVSLLPDSATIFALLVHDTELILYGAVIIVSLALLAFRPRDEPVASRPTV